MLKFFVCSTPYFKSIVPFSKKGGACPDLEYHVLRSRLPGHASWFSLNLPHPAVLDAFLERTITGQGQ